VSSKNVLQVKLFLRKHYEKEKANNFKDNQLQVSAEFGHQDRPSRKEN